MPTTHYEFLRSLQDAIHEQQVIVDEAIAAESRAEEAQTIRGLRSVSDLRADYYEGRAEEHLMRDGA